MSELRLSVDFESWPEYRELLAVNSERLPVVQSDGESIRRLIQLWKELAYQAPVTRRVGWLSERAARLTADPAVLACLEKVGLLVQEPDGGWMCPRFTKLHPHLDPTYESMQVKGRRRLGFKQAVEAAHESSAQMALGVDARLWVDGSGLPMDTDTVRKVITTLASLDAACSGGRRSTRLGHEYTQGLIAKTGALILKHPREIIEGVCVAVLDLRHAGLPTTAERLVDEFDKVLAIPEVRRLIAKT